MTIVRLAQNLADIRMPYSDEMPTVYPPHRRCSTALCETVLNRFNPGPLCLVHAQQVQSKMENPAIETIEELEELMAA